MQGEFSHVPVLLRECIEGLAIRPDGIYVDGTLGRAGHSLEIARRLTKGRLICIDQDEAAIEAAKPFWQNIWDRITLVRSNFQCGGRNPPEAGYRRRGWDAFDLGVSSPQLDDAERGFSYMHDAPLDMRMDRRAALTAHDIVNTWSAEELKRILYEYGEERYAGAIARSIVRAREDAPIGTTLQLVEVIRSALPAAAKTGKTPLPNAAFRPSALP